MAHPAIELFAKGVKDATREFARAARAFKDVVQVYEIRMKDLKNKYPWGHWDAPGFRKRVLPRWNRGNRLRRVFGTDSPLEDLDMFGTVVVHRSCPAKVVVHTKCSEVEKDDQEAE